MLFIAILSVMAGSGIAATCFRYFYKQHELIGGAVSSIDNYLKGDTNARIECDKEGKIYKLLQEAMQSLTQIQKERLYLYFFEGMTIREIAEKQNVNRNAVWKSLQVILEQLRTFFV